MERRKDLTKRLIAENFKALVVRSNFEKLTIKMIADEAGIIRPTFYNYFKDKYDVVEWIFCDEVLEEAARLLTEGHSYHALYHVFATMDEDRAYYRKVFTLTGQNGFEQVMEAHIFELFLHQISPNVHQHLPDNPVLTQKRIARHMSLAMISYLKEWILDDYDDVTPKQCTQGFMFLMTHPMFDFANDEAGHEKN